MTHENIDKMAMQLLQTVGLTLPVLLIALQILADNRWTVIETEAKFSVILLCSAGIFSVASVVSPLCENILFKIAAVLLGISLFLVGYIIWKIIE